MLRIRCLGFGWMSLTLLLIASPTMRADPEIYQKTLASTAWLVTVYASGGSCSGTGTLIDIPQRLLITNYHVVGEEKETTVYFPYLRDGRVESDPEYYRQNWQKVGQKGKVLFRDRKRDLAIVQVQTLPPHAQVIHLAEKSARPGENVHAIGNSGAKDGTLWRYSKGEVRQVYFKKMTFDDGHHVAATMLETNAPIIPGDSGGPMVNDRGELIALTQSGDRTGIMVKYGVDISEIRAFIRPFMQPSDKHGEPGQQPVLTNKHGERVDQ